MISSNYDSKQFLRIFIYYNSYGVQKSVVLLSLFAHILHTTTSVKINACFRSNRVMYIFLLLVWSTYCEIAVIVCFVPFKYFDEMRWEEIRRWEKTSCTYEQRKTLALLLKRNWWHKHRDIYCTIGKMKITLLWGHS